MPPSADRAARRPDRDARRATRWAAPLAIIALFGAAPAVADASSEAGDAVARAASYLVAQQDGAGRFGSVSSADGVAEGIVALVAAGRGGRPVERALGLIAAEGEARARGTGGRAGRIVLGLVAADRDPRAFAGTDFVAVLGEHYDELTGEFDGTNLYANALAALGWVAAGEALPERAHTFIAANRCADGGFGWRAACAGGADVDTTAMTLMVLVAAGGSAQQIEEARGWLARARNEDGGFGQPGQPTNANSTGLALSAIAALGEDPRDEPWRRDGRDPVEALLSLQAADGGFRYLAAREQADGYATIQALPGLGGRALPVGPARSSDPGAPSSPGASARSSARSAAPPAATAGSSRGPAPSDAPVAVGPADRGGPARVAGASTERAREGRSAVPIAIAGAGAAGVGGAVVGRLRRRRKA